MPDQQNITNIPSNRVEFIDPRTGLVSREWYRFFLNLFNLAGAGGNQISLDEMQIGPPPQPDSGGGGGGTGTVTSVDVSGGTTGLTTTGGPVTSSGTITLGGTLAITNGGTGATTAGSARSALGATTVGGNMFTLTNPSAVTFPQFNADNTVFALDAASFRTAIGAGTGGGSVTSVGTAGTVNGLTLTGGPITASGTITLGGTLDLSSPPAIGGTTPAAGVFTTLTATGQTSLGGAAGAEGLRVTTTASANRYVQISGGQSGVSSPSVGVAGGSTALDLYTNGGGTFNFYTNGNGSARQVAFTHTASAVNYVQVTGAATGGRPVVSAQGSDTNIALGFDSKGTGAHIFRTNGLIQSQIVNTASAVNYTTQTGSATGNGVIFGAAGTDTNISQVFQSKGTGAIDLAAGSKGVNISNGGTVTALTLTAGGSGYTSIPSVVIPAPTTAGGVQATATVGVLINTSSLASGGTGYTAGDTLTVVGGTGTAATISVSTVSAGVITGYTQLSGGTYTVLPSSPFSVTGGAGTGATFNILTLAVRSSSFTITNAGSGYVEQPTVSFSGGGGSGAAAYARIGSEPVVRSIGQQMSIATASGTQLQIGETFGATLANTNFIISGRTSGSAVLGVVSTDTNAGTVFYTKGTGSHQFFTQGTNSEQLRIANTSSAVNYVQVTGAATGAYPVITAQGSDSNITMGISSKGTNTVSFYTNNNSSRQFAVTHTTGTVVNYATATGAAAGSAPVFGVAGSDTNIDLTLTPKGTGVVRTSGTGIRLYGSSSGYVGLTGAAAAGSTTYTLPAADGTTGQMLSTNGSGTLSWATGGSSNITTKGLWENSATISADYSITSGNNALSSGPVTIASGVAVTVPSGSVWTIV